MAGKLKITMVRSIIGRSRKQREVLEGLGLRRMHHSVVREDSPSVRGMVQKLAFMLRVESV
ncbi:MAG TPA: 50S ribosomal protein L30 [Myxococcota bacterium]|nr:50S ribosomal protein L30 [Myxococcota bacterium]HRY94445.1 50S ribosomal protein L30 [Myxococcota bacterium]